MLEISSLGARLRELRRDRGRTLRQVAADTGFTVGYLSQIETGATTPSLTALAMIAASLESDLADFFAPDAAGDVRITRGDDPDRFAIAPNGHEEYVLLSGRVGGGEFTALQARHLPGGPLLRYRHTGEEHALVLDGCLRFEIDGDTRLVGAGEWIHYRSECDHSGVVVSEGPAEVLWVLRPGIL